MPIKSKNISTRLRSRLKAIQNHEGHLSRALLDTFRPIPGLRVYGLSDLDRIGARVPTFSITLEGWHPRRLAEHLAQAGINVWVGNDYALAVRERLGLEGKGGVLRVGLAHYNTPAEVDALLAALDEVR